MDLDLKKNSVIWDGKRQGFYEAYYVQVNDPVSGMAWWFRYSILVPKKGKGTPYAALWAVQYDQSGARGPIAMKHIYPISHFRCEKDRFILYIEDGFLTGSHATGKIKHGDRSLSWDIQWVPIDNNFIHYPEFWYKMPIPRTKLVSPNRATTGGGFIRWNEGEFYLKDALIHVGHVWGASHSKRWVWVRSHGFEENPTVVFEGLWIPIVGSFGVSMCWLNLDGELTRMTNFGNSWQLKNMQSSNAWGLNASNPKFGIDGEVVIDPSRIAGITYHDPDGSRRFCYNSKVATIRMNAFNKGSGDISSLTAPGTAAFEICLPSELDKFQILV